MDSDELLIELMCENNFEAKTEFEKRYIEKIKLWLTPYRNIIKYLRLEPIDFLSSSYIKVINTLPLYDKKYGEFSAFARRCVINEINGLIKTANVQARKGNYEALSLNTQMDDGHNIIELIPGDYLISSIVEYINIKEATEKMKDNIASLSPMEKKIVYKRGEEESSRDIRSSLSLNEKQYEYRLSCIRKKLTNKQK